MMCAKVCKGMYDVCKGVQRCAKVCMMCAKVQQFVWKSPSEVRGCGRMGGAVWEG